MQNGRLFAGRFGFRSATHGPRRGSMSHLMKGDINVAVQGY